MMENVFLGIWGCLGILKSCGVGIWGVESEEEKEEMENW